MRVLGVLAAWGVLAVLATLCFAVGGSIGYRRGVQDAVRQLRERRSGKTGCRPMPLSHHRRRPITRISLRSAVEPSRARSGRPAFPAHAPGPRSRRFAGVQWSPAAIGAAVAVCVLAVPGVAIGATTAQPGERLWEVKRGLERARLAMATGAADDVEVHVDLAARRLSELNQLLSMGHADPQVVGVVIDGLHDHTEAATERLNEVDVADRVALVEHVDGLVERQVAVIDLLIGVDCTDGADQQCVALGDTREASAELQRTTSAIALAEDVPAGDAVDPVAGQTDLAVSSVATTASTEAATDVAASGAASESASATPSPEASAGPSQGPTTPASSPDVTSGAASAATSASTAAAQVPADDGTPSNGAPSPSTSSAGAGGPPTSGNANAAGSSSIAETAEQPSNGSAP